jgi:hypothetical protein
MNLVLQRGRRLIAVFAVGVLLALIAPLAAPAPAGAAATGTISGTVLGVDRHPSGDPVLSGPLPGARVSAVNTATGSYVRSATTDAQGRFSLAALPPATYQVKYLKSGWLGAWSGPIVLAAGQTKALGTRTLAAEAVITGQVLSWMDPIGGAKVIAFDAVSGKGVAATIADISGEYRIGQLPAGSYKVRAAKAGHFDSWADGATTWAKATTYSLVAGQVLEQSWDPVRLYLDIAPALTITGSVFGFSSTDPTGTAGAGCAGDWDDPLGGVRVSAVDAATGAFIRSVVTDSAGEYRIAGLPTGMYRIKLKKDCWSTTWYPAEVYGLIGGTVDAGQGFMYGETVISGQVLSNMDPVGGARVSVIDTANGTTIAATVADASGYYRLGQLPVGAGPMAVKVKAAKAGYRDSWANYPATWSNAQVYQLMPGYHLSQNWSPQPQLYLDLQPLP